MMKHFYTLTILVLFALTSQAQNSYEFAIEHNNGYNFSVIATPNFDASNTDVSDIGFTLMLPTGNADVINLSQFNGRAWSSTEVTAAQLTSFALGDGTRDGFAMNLPPGQTILSHTNGTPFVLVSFEISNMPLEGLIEILSNTDPIALGLGGAVDSFYNSNIDSTTTQNYFGGLSLGMESFSFDTLGIEQTQIEDHTISIYPNPASAFITINYQHQIEKVEVYNILGKLIFQKQKTKTIDINSFSEGIYILKIHTIKGVVSKKVVKK